MIHATKNKRETLNLNLKARQSSTQEDSLGNLLD